MQQQPPPESEMTLPSRPAPVRPAPLNTRPRQQEDEPRHQHPRPEMDVRDIMNRSPPTPGVDDTPYIRFAIEQLTRDEELMGHGRQGSVTSEDYPIQRVIPDDGLGYLGLPAPPSRPPQQPGKRPPDSANLTKRPSRGEILLPVGPPSGNHWSELGYLPAILRLPCLLILLLICILLLTGAAFSNVFASRHNGLFDYDGTGTARYFIFQFLPQLLGILLILWLFTLEAAIYRVLPLIAMSSSRPRHGVSQNLRLYTANFVLPDLSFFRHGEPLVGVVLLIFWLTNFTVPLLSSFYQTEYVMSSTNPRWRWTAVQAIGWSLVALFALLVLAVIGVMLRFQRKRSALMWDPVCLADLIPLFQRSNILVDFDQLEISESVNARITSRDLRLGYWTTSKSQNTFYAVGEPDRPTDRVSYPSPGRLTEKYRHQDDADSTTSLDLEHQRHSYASSFTRSIHSPFVRYRFVPWCLRDSAVLAWIIIALILLTAFLIVSFLHHAVQNGFLPLLPSGNESGAFSPSNFLYSFLPTLLGMLLFLAWQPIDVAFRSLQPFANLSSTTGSAAQHSLLLSYPSQLPLLVTFRAIANGDFKVAWISFISTASLAIPVLAGGVFTAQFFSNSSSIRIAACMPAYYTLCVFLAVYAVSFLIIWPKRKRYLPHSVRTLADLLSFLYASPLLVSDPALAHIRTKADLVGRLMFPPQGLEDTAYREARYGFGIYIGRDGREHLGIDRLQRPGGAVGADGRKTAGREMLITTGGDTGPNRGLGSFRR